MAKPATPMTRAPAGRKTPAKAKKETKPKSGTASKKNAPEGKKATASKKKGEEPYPNWAAPTPSAALEAVARLAAVHGIKDPPQKKTILDSLVRTILSQNTTDKTSAVAFSSRRFFFCLPRQAHSSVTPSAELCLFYLLLCKFIC